MAAARYASENLKSTRAEGVRQVVPSVVFTIPRCRRAPAVCETGEQAQAGAVGHEGSAGLASRRLSWPGDEGQVRWVADVDGGKATAEQVGRRRTGAGRSRHGDVTRQPAARPQHLRHDGTHVRLGPQLRRRHALARK